MNPRAAKPRRTAAARSTAAQSPEADFARLVAAWFQAEQRSLPWRIALPGGGRDPYRALVSEAMLQQTQVSRVVDKFHAFVDRFPTVHDLAAADEHDVLALWSGLGYYRRARNLHAAAKLIVADFDGRVPRTAEDLRRLPGVGRYTAGAIASIAHGQPAPIVDGNVARVLLRVHGKALASDDKAAQAWLWDRAAALVQAAESPALFNEGLMELGAVVCTPGTPNCPACPVRARCIAERKGLQLEIPRPKQRAARTTIHCAVAIVERGDGALLVERRPDHGMWASMWQAPTIERTDRAPTRAELARAVGLKSLQLGPAETMRFLATHRELTFAVHRVGVALGWRPRRGEFKPRPAIARLGLGSIQRRILLGK